LRIDNLGCGTLLPPLASGFHPCRWIIQRAYSKLHQTIPGMPIFIPGTMAFLIAILSESLSIASRFRYRHHPGILIAFIPERLSPYPGLRIWANNHKPNKLRTGISEKQRGEHCWDSMYFL
jgi:hypothetical protein